MATARTVATGPDKIIPTHLPLPEYFRWAWEQNQRLLFGAKATGNHKYRSPMWEFVRLMAAHPKLKGLGAEDAFRLVAPLEVHQGERSLSWSELFLLSGDPAAEFMSTWNKVRVPAGDDILILADGLARDKLIRLRFAISEKYSRYVSIAFHLQVLRSGQYINLPVARLAKILKVDQRTVSYYAEQAKRSGYLELIGKHHQPSGTAAKYIFRCGRFNLETGEELTAKEGPDFRKECKDSEDSKDLKESHDQRERIRSVEEPERRGGSLGFVKDLERNSGKGGAARSSENERSDVRERRKLLQAQAILVGEGFRT